MTDRIAYHFTGDTLRDGQPIPAIGETLKFNGEMEICRSGYHWSRKPHQALEYAPGPMLHKVSFGGDVQEQDDKGVSTERTILATVDATSLLRRFAADQALSVAHLWDMPNVVRDYLTTLNEDKRAAAMDAAGAAMDAAGAAMDAAGAARAAAMDAAMDAAWAAAWARADGQLPSDAAMDAAWADFDKRVYSIFGDDA